MGRGARGTAVHEVAKSQTRLIEHTHTHTHTNLEIHNEHFLLLLLIFQ